MPRTTRIGIALAIAALLAVLAVGLVFAQEQLLGGKLRTGNTVTVPASESVEGDLYVLGGTVTVDGSVDGDLTAMGGTVQLNGSVTGDVLAAGGTVTISGDVAGDVRTAGGQVNLNGPVGEDAVVAGGQATLQGGASVEGDLVASGGQVSMGGAVAGNVEANAGTYSRSGTVGGTEHVVQGGRGPAGEPEGDTVGRSALDAVRHFVVLLLLGALLMWLLPRFFGRAETTLREQPAASLGWGVATFIGYIVLVIVAIIVIVLLAILFGVLQLGVLAAIEVFGGLLGLLVVTFGFVLAVAFLADLVVGYGLARQFGGIGQSGWWQRFGLLAVGVAAVVIVTSLPVIGGIAKLLVVLFGLGALFLAARAAWRGRGVAYSPPPAVTAD